MNIIEQSRAAIEESERLSHEYGCMTGRHWEPIGCNDNCKYPKVYDGLCGAAYRDKYHMTLHETKE